MKRAIPYLISLGIILGLAHLSSQFGEFAMEYSEKRAFTVFVSLLILVFVFLKPHLKRTLLIVFGCLFLIEISWSFLISTPKDWAIPNYITELKFSRNFDTHYNAYDDWHTVYQAKHTEYRVTFKRILIFRRATSSAYVYPIEFHLKAPERFNELIENQWEIPMGNLRTISENEKRAEGEKFGIVIYDIPSKIIGKGTQNLGWIKVYRK